MQVKLSFWVSQSPNVDRYRVKYGNSEANMDQSVDFAAAGMTSNPSQVTVTGLDATQPWYFEMVALNPFDLESAPSNIVNTAVAPDPPTNLAVAAMLA